jgi:hypothetical protein
VRISLVEREKVEETNSVNPFGVIERLVDVRRTVVELAIHV